MLQPILLNWRHEQRFCVRADAPGLLPFRRKVLKLHRKCEMSIIELSLPVEDGAEISTSHPSNASNVLHYT